MDAEKNQKQEKSTETAQPASGEQVPQVPNDTDIQDIYVLIVREREEEAQQSQVVESAPTKQVKQNFAYVTLCIVLLCCLPMFGSIAFQVYALLNPPIATITIVPKTQAVTLTGTLQLGRVLHQITLRQSATTPTTGKGHQDAKAARGLIAFYNGLFTSQIIQAGTILTSSSGVQIATDQAAEIPAANPPNLGQTTVSAHAIQTGTQGNITGYDIDTPCCLTAVKAVNTTYFTGGQDERDFSTVSTQDIHTVSTQLIPTLTQNMQAALHNQLTPQEQLQPLPCTPTQTSDHQIGQAATLVKVTFSETCSGIAFNTQKLTSKVTQLLTSQAIQKLGTGYSLIGDAHVTVNQATEHNKKVVLSFSSQGTWVYAVKSAEQQRIKSLIAGKTKQEAEQLLASMPGIEQASIRWGDETKLPKNSKSIRVVVMYGI
jgi:hypothetical protein